MLVNKNANSLNGHMTELESHLKELNITSPKIEDRSRYTRTIGRIDSSVLVYYGVANYNDPVNPYTNPRTDLRCNCGNFAFVHEFHGVVGVAKFDNGLQVDYQEGDIEAIYLGKNSRSRFHL